MVATESEAIVRRVEAFGREAMLTTPDHQSGTERIAEVAERIEEDLILNVWGDEPFLSPHMLRSLLGNRA